MRNPNYINSSGYYSPTEGKAIDHIIRDERKKAKAERAKAERAKAERRKQDANRKRKLQNFNSDK